jgi:hypothetical protein
MPGFTSRAREFGLTAPGLGLGLGLGLRLISMGTVRVQVQPVGTAEEVKP